MNTTIPIAPGQTWRLKPSPCGYSCEFAYDIHHLEGRPHVPVFDGTVAEVRSVTGDIFLDYRVNGWLRTLRMEAGRLVKNWECIG